MERISSKNHNVREEYRDKRKYRNIQNIKNRRKDVRKLDIL